MDDGGRCQESADYYYWQTAWMLKGRWGDEEAPLDADGVMSCK